MLEDQDSNRPAELFLDSRNHKGPSFVDPRFMICSGYKGITAAAATGRGAQSRNVCNLQCLPFDDSPMKLAREVVPISLAL